MTDYQSLRQQLHRLEGRSYPAYKQLRGRYQFPQFELVIDHVQGDPFAAPSRVCLQVPPTVAQFPPDWQQTVLRRMALADYLHRQLYRLVQQVQQRRGSGNSGQITLPCPSQAILQRTAVQVTETGLAVRLGVGLPALGRRIAGEAAIALLCEDLPTLVAQGLCSSAMPAAAVEQHLHSVEDAVALRRQLSQHQLAAFIPNGAILPRRSGIDDRPLETALPFQAPAALQVTLTAPHAGSVSGLGIPVGITLIVGGGYHGKSTLLRALEQGVYNHIPGDGREQVVTAADAVKIRAEDGRSVTGVDISPFINQLPQGISTRQFSTANASGSTSQAASIIEAIEAGAQVLLIDEDTAATNFMIRDRAMQALIAKDKEPITPLIDKVRLLYDDYGISTLLVMGGSGDYFAVADTVIALENYQPRVVTAQAQAIAREYPTQRQPEGGDCFGPLQPRQIELPPSDPRRPGKVRVRDVDQLVVGTEAIDLRAVEQLIEPAQVRAIAEAIRYLQDHQRDQHHSLPELLDRLMALLDEAGLDSLSPYPRGDLSQFRRHELAAAINRLRTLKVRFLA